jgi:hypothetical protein
VRLASAALLAILLVGCRPSAEAPRLVHLDEAGYDSLKSEFNRAGDAQRVLVLLSPT